MLQTANNVDCCYKLSTVLAFHTLDKWTTSTSRKKKWMLFLFFFYLLSFPDPHSLGPDVDNGGEGQKTDGELQLRSRDPYKYKYIINDQLFLATIFLLQLHSNTTQLASCLAVWHDLHLFCDFLAPSTHCCWSPIQVTCTCQSLDVYVSMLWHVFVTEVICIFLRWLSLILHFLCSFHPLLLVSKSTSYLGQSARQPGWRSSSIFLYWVVI